MNRWARLLMQRLCAQRLRLQHQRMPPLLLLVGFIQVPQRVRIGLHNPVFHIHLSDYDT